MAKKHWTEINSTTWRSLIDPKYTIEIGRIDGYDEEDPDSVAYYVYPALHGEGIPNSPEVIYSGDPATDLKDAKKLARQLMRIHSGPDLEGFDWRSVDFFEVYKTPKKRKKGRDKSTSPRASVRGVRR